MSIMLGTSALTGARVGNTVVASVRLGFDLIWSNALPPATVLLDLADGAGDGYHYWPFQPNDYLDAVTAALWPGQAGRVFCAYRLPLDLAPGTQVTAARLRFTSRNADGPVQTRVAAYAAVNAAPPPHLDGATAITQTTNLTGASVDWNMPGTAANETFWSPDLAAVLNELLALGNRAGDRVVMWVVNTSSGWTEKDVRAFEAGASGRPALEISYSRTL